MAPAAAVLLVMALALMAPPVAGAAGAPGATPPVASSGNIGVRLIEIPADSRNDSRAQLYIVDHLAPGATIERLFEVTNTTASTAHVLLYAAAAGIEDGSFLGAEGHTPNELSSWTSVSPGTADVRAGGTVRVTVRIAVPPDAAPGEQYGAVWAEVGSGPAGDDGFAVVNRVGIRLYLSVGPGGPPAADFTIDSLTAQRSPDGQPIVRAAVHNTGGRALDMSGTLQLVAGPGGLKAGPFPADVGVTLAIGGTEPVSIALDSRLPDGPWEAEITLHSGLVERTARATITFPETGSGPPVVTVGSSTNRLPAIVAAGVILTGLGLGMILLFLRRRRNGVLPHGA